MMCYYLNVHFQGQTVNIILPTMPGVLKWCLVLSRIFTTAYYSYVYHPACVLHTYITWFMRNTQLDLAKLRDAFFPSIFTTTRFGPCRAVNLPVPRHRTAILRNIYQLHKLYRAQLRLFGLTGNASHPDMQRIMIIGFFFENRLHWHFEVAKNF